MQRIVLPKGQRFGRLKVDHFIGVSAHGKSLYHCICDCGEETTAIVSELKNGHTQSCGCLFRELRAAGMGPRTHGRSGTPEHVAWKNMHARCRRDPDYVSRGIKVCDRWSSFENFFADMGTKNAPGHELSVDRIDNDGNYKPSNCRWATIFVQNNNRRPRRWHKKPKENGA